MARIPTTELEQLKSHIAVTRPIEAAGIVLKKSGKDQLGCARFMRMANRLWW